IGTQICARENWWRGVGGVVREGTRRRSSNYEDNSCITAFLVFQSSRFPRSSLIGNETKLPGQVDTKTVFQPTTPVKVRKYCAQATPNAPCRSRRPPAPYSNTLTRASER